MQPPAESSLYHREGAVGGRLRWWYPSMATGVCGPPGWQLSEQGLQPRHLHFTAVKSGTSSALAAPIIFPGINPSRCAFLITSIFPARCFWKLSGSLIKSLRSLSFSTKIVLGRFCAGVWSMNLLTVLSEEDKALSLGCHPKDPLVSQYLNYIMSCACLQEMKKISEHKDQGAECKNQDGNGASCAKGPVQKDWVQQKIDYTGLKASNRSTLQPISTEAPSQSGAWAHPLQAFIKE